MRWMGQGGVGQEAQNGMNETDEMEQNGWDKMEGMG